MLEENQLEQVMMGFADVKGGAEWTSAKSRKTPSNSVYFREKIGRKILLALQDS